MKNSHLVQLVQSLTNKEKKGLSSFLAAPFFNKRPEVSALFDYLQSTTVSPNKKAAFTYIRPNGTFDDQQMRLWMSWLLKLIERYLVLQALENDQLQWDLLLCQALRHKQLDNLLEKQLRTTKKHLSTASYQHAIFHRRTYEQEFETYYSLRKQKRMRELNLQTLSDQLDIAYFSDKLKNACMAITHQTIYKTTYDLGLLPNILDYIEQKELTQIPVIGLYYAAYQMLSQADAQRFYHFKTLLLIHGTLFPPDERGDFYLLAINFCIRKYNQGESDYLKDELELYQDGLRQALFEQNQYLSRFTYRNVVTVGLILEEYTWVEEFIMQYRNKLAPQYRIQMSSFCLAYLAYSRKDYDNALLLLQKANYKDLLLNLAAKALLLKVFYELDEINLLDAHLDAMQQFIRRKQQLVYHHNHYLQLIYFTRRLHELRPNDRQQKDQLRQEIIHTKEVAEKRWLLAQI